MSEQPRQFRVLADYEVVDPHPLRVRAGNTVRPQREDSGWPGWVWVEVPQQHAGWIPVSCLENARAESTICRMDFDGTDLSACRGDLLTALHTEPGWIFARHPDGRTGWFPLFNLKPVPRI